MNPANMPGAKLTPAGAIARLITDLSAIADDGSAIDLDVCSAVAELTSAYAQLLTAQTRREVKREQR